MEKLLKDYPDSDIVILSGEGEGGTFEHYTGKRAPQAIKTKLTRERCHGDRWAKAYIYLHESETGCVYVNLEDTRDMREIDEDDI